MVLHLTLQSQYVSAPKRVAITPARLIFISLLQCVKPCHYPCNLSGQGRRAPEPAYRCQGISATRAGLSPNFYTFSPILAAALFLAPMPRTAKPKAPAAPESIEKTLWSAADKLRKNLDAAVYKEPVLGLVFLKHISDTFEEAYAEIKAQEAQGADPEDPFEYKAINAFYVPEAARFSFLLANASQPHIGKLVNEAMDALEAQNEQLKGILPRGYTRDGLSAETVGELINKFASLSLGTKGPNAKDTLGRVYEYFLGQFALAEGQKGGQLVLTSC